MRLVLCVVCSSYIAKVNIDRAGDPAVEIMKPHLNSIMLMDDWLLRRIVKITTSSSVCTYCWLPKASDHLVVSSLTDRSLVRLGAAAAVELRP
jgi:hypothetical protein